MPGLPVRAFLDVLDEVEGAKEALVAAVPSARVPGRPLADALHAFEERVGRAEDLMAAWRQAAVSDEWERCGRGVEEARRRAEAFRLEAPELGFEALIARISELIDPLEPFEEAARRFEELGASLR